MDFSNFGDIDNPLEGSDRIYLPQIGENDAISFILNDNGKSWINAEWTTLGLRGGYDIENFYSDAQDTEIRIYFALEPIGFEPRLIVTYAAFNLECNDGIDNDGDGFVDWLEDPGCDSPEDFTETNLFQCNDGIDNDNDGYIDYSGGPQGELADPGCDDPYDIEWPVNYQCNDGIDNDNDGFIDFEGFGQESLDQGCTSNYDISEEYSCNDGLDNDGDGFIDFDGGPQGEPADPGCRARLDDSEKYDCSDGEDNYEGAGGNNYLYKDGLIDEDDPGCWGSGEYDPLDGDESHTSDVCSDNFDNDGDALIDENDPGCWDYGAWYLECGYSASDWSEVDTLLVCNDCFDNDGDGRVDNGLANYPDVQRDFGCYSSSEGYNIGDESESPDACNDGIDNDNDGKVDYPNDIECRGIWDTELLKCSDGTPEGQCNGDKVCRDGGLVKDCNICECEIGGGTCFLPGTQISLADGTTKNIEDIKTGDMILSYDFENEKVVSDVVVSPIVHTRAAKKYLKINDVEVTPEHLFWIDGEWKGAGKIKLGDKFLKDDGSFEVVKTIEEVEGLFTVYNFETEKYHNYFAEGKLVHNARKDVPICDGLEGEEYEVCLENYYDTTRIG